MPLTKRLPVAVVDDHTLFRATLADMIDSLGNYEVVVQASNGLEYLEAVKGGTHVSVAIVDLHMPVMDGYATLQWIRTNSPGTRALALTFERTEEAMVKALRAGACGFLRKDVGKQGFREALEQVAQLGHYYNDDPGVPLDTQPEAVDNYQRTQEDLLTGLTDRELEFLRLVCDAEEHTYEVISQRMGVHRRTIDGYRESLFTKFNIKSKAGLVIFAYKWGLNR